MLTTFGGVIGQMANLVPPNPKCQSCLHYLTNQSACEIGLNPSICGDGTMPMQGYAPVDSTGPDPTWTELPDDGMVQPLRTGEPLGTGQPKVAMSSAHLGDASELLALSNRMIPDLVKSAKEGCAHHAYNDGGIATNLYAAKDSADGRCQCLPLSLDDIAKAIHLELDNNVRSRVSVNHVKAFVTKHKLF